MATPEQTYAASPAASPAGWEEAVLQAVRAVRYGSVEITIHDAHVVQVERREKVRFQDVNPRSPSAHATRPPHRTREGQ